MRGPEDDWETLIAGVRAGEPVALGTFYRLYGPSLERLAARAIDPGMRRRFGPESIANSVCRTFMMRARNDAYELADGDSLWRLLCVIALTKVRERSRFHLRQRRGLQREEHARGAADGDDTDDPLLRSPAETPAPEDEAVFREQFQVLLDALDQEERRVLELRLEARSQQEIADEMAISERTVRRILKRVEERFARSLA